jgi:general secretion pathway protein C
MTAELVFKRVFPFVVVALLGVAAYFQARGLTELLAISLMGDGVRAPLAAKPPARLEPASKPPPESRAAGALSSAGSAPADPLSWPSCKDAEVVIVTESPDPSWSLTSIRMVGEPRARLRRAGDVLGGKQLVFIGFNPRWQAPAVWLEGGADSCQSVLTRRAEAPLGAPAEEPMLTAAHVGRGTVEKTLANPLSLRSVRVVPEQVAGKLAGVRLFGVRPGSILDSVGIRNGDRIETVNGVNIAIPSQALEAYGRLRRAHRLMVHLVRAGQPLDLQLNID